MGLTIYDANGIPRGGAGSHNILSGTHPDTGGAGAEARGDLLVRNSASQWTRLAVGTSTQLLHGGTDPSYSAVATADIADNAVTNAKLRDSAAFSVIGRQIGTSGDPGDIAASADGVALKRLGGIVGFLADPWFTIHKTADQTRSSTTTLANDADMTFSTNTSVGYTFRLHVFYNTPAAADFKFTINHSATTTRIRWTYSAILPDGTSVVALETASGTPVSLTTAITGNGYIAIVGILQSGGTGTLAFQWAQNTSDAGNTTVYEGSYIEYEQEN